MASSASKIPHQVTSLAHEQKRQEEFLRAYENRCQVIRSIESYPGPGLLLTEMKGRLEEGKEELLYGAYRDLQIPLMGLKRLGKLKTERKLKAEKEKAAKKEGKEEKKEDKAVPRGLQPLTAVDKFLIGQLDPMKPSDRGWVKARQTLYSKYFDRSGKDPITDQELTDFTTELKIQLDREAGDMGMAIDEEGRTAVVEINNKVELDIINIQNDHLFPHLSVAERAEDLKARFIFNMWKQDFLNLCKGLYEFAEKPADDTAMHNVYLLKMVTGNPYFEANRRACIGAFNKLCTFEGEEGQHKLNLLQFFINEKLKIPLTSKDLTIIKTEAELSRSHPLLAILLGDKVSDFKFSTKKFLCCGSQTLTDVLNNLDEFVRQLDLSPGNKTKNIEKLSAKLSKEIGVKLSFAECNVRYDRIVAMRNGLPYEMKEEPSHALPAEPVSPAIRRHGW